MLLIKSLSAIRGMGCTTNTADQDLPTEWEAKRVRRKRPRGGKRRRRHSSAAAAAADGSAALLPDVWCTPGIALAMDAAAVDCVVAKRGRIASRRRENAERALGESHGILCEQIRTFQANNLTRGSERDDQYRELRLDIDNMSYEELLELGEKIGQVNIGLGEEEISRCVRKMRFTLNALPAHVSSPLRWRCSICQEEYHSPDVVGRLDCNHKYHFYCIKRWLRRKNACPICNVAAA